MISVYDRDYPLSLDRRLRLVEQADETFGTVVAVDFRDAAATKHSLAEARFRRRHFGRRRKALLNLMRQLIVTVDYRRSKAASQPTTAEKPHDVPKAAHAQRDLLETTLTQLEDEMLQRSDTHDSVATPGPAEAPTAAD